MVLGFNMLKSKPAAFKTDYLVRLNVPAFCARRDMAYDSAIRMLGNNLSSLPKRDRLKRYATISRLLDEAKETAHMIVSSSGTGEYTDPYEQYLILLVDTLQAATSLLKHEIMLEDEEKEMGVFIGKNYLAQSKLTDKIFSQSEQDILLNIIELVKAAELPIGNFRKNSLKKFSEDELERYNKAGGEFSKLYSALESGERPADEKTNHSFSDK